jgi:hypothetical protein
VSGNGKDPGMDQRTIAVVIGHVEVQETTTVRQVSLHARPYGPLGAALRVGGIGSIVWAFFFRSGEIIASASLPSSSSSSSSSQSGLVSTAVGDEEWIGLGASWGILNLFR